MSAHVSRRQFLRAGAVAGSAAAGLPVLLSPTAASAYSVPAKMAWWYAGRFGMFIHFGSYSYLGHGEWAFSIENWTKAAYQAQVSAPFNPSRFSASTIVGLAKTAGMKYLVITAKHHEGFAMWDSAVPSFTDTTGTKRYNLHAYTAYQPDLLAALKAECDAQGIRFGLYYSILDWNHRSQTIRHTDTTFSTMSSLAARASYITDMKAQLQELLTRYDPAILWFDGDWCANQAAPTLADWWIESDGQSLYNWLVGLKPGLIVNERVKRGFGLGDFECPEQMVPARPLARQWETCATMNGAWGYNAGSENSYRSPQAIIRELVTVVSRDGNYLLNIGPRGDGTPTPGSVTILNALGSWMSVHSDSIYGTTGSPYPAEPAWGLFTKKTGKLFAHVFTWPSSGMLQIPALQNSISRISLLNAPGTSLNYTVSGGYINVTVPASAPNANDSVVVVEVSGDPVPATGSAVVSGGVYKLVCAHSGKALDNGNTTTNGATVMQWTDNGGTPQHWTVNSVGGGIYQLICQRSGKALDNGSVGTAGSSLVQWTANSGTPQRWAITATGNGNYKLICQHSGLALDDGGATGNGAPMVQRPDNGAASQQWQLVRVA
ncbi:MAG: alpha-L-fucosidase [Micromonosporaceae bacterium]